MRKALVLMSLAAAAGGAFAKLPPPAPEAAQAAAAAKDKAAWADKVAAYKLCLSQDKLAKQYLKEHPNAKKPSAEVPACADPGPYVPSAPAAAQAPAQPAAQPAQAQAAAAPANGQPAPAKK